MKTFKELREQIVFDPKTSIHIQKRIEDVFAAAMKVERVPEPGFDEPAFKMICSAVEKLKLTPNDRYKVMKLAKGIADFEGSQKVKTEHYAEAISYHMYLKYL